MSLRTRRDFHDELEIPLLERHRGDALLVGKIDGLLVALAALDGFVDHAPTFGFVELDSRGDLGARLRELCPHVGTIELVPVASWPEHTRAALTSIAIEASAPALGPELRAALPKIIAAIVVLLGRLFEGPHDVKAYRVAAAPPSGARGLFGYLGDETMAFEAGDRRYLLGLGWTD